ncbi:hypothetical protein Plec18167_003916 [Paecilomyces lecythidis]|uniref:ABC transporter domain-containing protein n=1 Tax=Paecilomyces lecythidis TaxID=3004212 RepID=A0ABR3XUR4_9EURO
MANTNTIEAAMSSASSTDIERQPYGIQKRLTVTFRDLSIRVTAPDAALGSTLLSAADPRRLLSLFQQGKQPKRLLVLGRPGSGCTSFLRVLSNDRAAFDEVLGETRYGSMDHKEAKAFRQQIMFNNEDDIHFPTLTVNRTIKFALGNKVPRERPSHLQKRNHFVRENRNDILQSLRIDHTQKTMVGNEYVRGVSGGERKRVSLAEFMAGGSPVQLWDQPTRGLDSKTAVELARLMRREADRKERTIVATMYQAGNGIYDEFDKVLVLAEGRVIYYGYRSTARKYFEDMGFVCPKGANVADFLTSVTVSTERVIRPGMEGKVPSTPVEFEKCYKESAIFSRMMDEIVPPEKLMYEVEDLKLAVANEKRKQHIPRTQSVYTAGLWDQIVACTIRLVTYPDEMPSLPN